MPERCIGSDKIRRLNDALRRFHIGGRVLLSLGITCLSENAIAAILNAVRTYDGFSKENDPENVHDFGIIEVGEHTVMFKIDVASAPRSDTSDALERVLTIVLADEW